MTEATQLRAGISDVVVGIVDLLTLAVSGMTEPSIPNVSSAIKWFVPCPKPISRADRFLTVFDAFVWLTIVIVFVLTSAFFWFSANYPDRMVENQSKILQTIPKCMYNAWSIFIGVFVPKMPKSWKLIMFFPDICVLLLCYKHSVSDLFRIVSCRNGIWRKV